MLGDRLSLIAPSLDTLGFWCAAGKLGKHLSHNQRPGGRLDTLVKTDFDESNNEAKESKPERLNRCHNEDPYVLATKATMKQRRSLSQRLNLCHNEDPYVLAKFDESNKEAKKESKPEA
jgi:hypothetical protein